MKITKDELKKMIAEEISKEEAWMQKQKEKYDAHWEKRRKDRKAYLAKIHGEEPEEDKAADKGPNWVSPEKQERTPEWSRRNRSASGPNFPREGKITKSELERIIKEELESLLQEQESFFAGDEEETAAGAAKQEVRMFRDATNKTIENLKMMQASWPALTKATQVRDRIKKRGGDGVRSLSDLARRLNKLIQAMEKNLQLVVAGEEPLSESINLSEDGVFGSEEARLKRLADAGVDPGKSGREGSKPVKKAPAEKKAEKATGPGFDKSTGYPDVWDLRQTYKNSLDHHGSTKTQGNMLKWTRGPGALGGVDPGGRQRYVSKNFDAFILKFLNDSREILGTIFDDLQDILEKHRDIPLS